MKRTLEPVKEIKFNPWVMFFWIFVFALVFWIIGSFFKHYPSLSSAI